MTTKKKKEALKKMLLEKKREVWGDIKERLFEQLGKEYRREIETALDEGDRALANLAEETGITIVNLRKEMLEKIDQALEKLDQDTYGICEDCGGAISDQRLKAVPFAVYCIECKQKRAELEQIEQEREPFRSPALPEAGEEI